MKKTLAILTILTITLSLSKGTLSQATAQRVRTTAVFDADTTTRPRAGFYGVGVRSGNVFLVRSSGNTVRLANYSLFTGLTTNFLTKWDGSKLVNSQLSESSGFLNSYVPNLVISGTYPTVYLNGTQANGTNIQLRNYVGGVSNSGFEIYDNTNSASRLAISGSGNVGVGTTTPNRRLVVNGDFGFSYSDGSSYAGIRQNLSGGHFGVEFFNVISSSPTNRAFSFLDYTLNPIMSLLNGGNVGIGTASPSAKFHINFSSSAQNGLLVNNSENSGYFNLYQNGSVAFGVPNWPNSTLLESVSSGNLVLGSFSNKIVLQTGNRANHSVIDFNGNLGIGTTAPTSKLQVVGLPTYADNAAATSGGLTAGAFYRTSTGVLMVVY